MGNRQPANMGAHHPHNGGGLDYASLDQMESCGPNHAGAHGNAQPQSSCGSSSQPQPTSTCGAQPRGYGHNHYGGGVLPTEFFGGNSGRYFEAGSPELA